MKYQNKTTNRLMSEMAKRKGKKFIGKSGEHLGGLDNTMTQQTGQGTLARSSAIAVGKISNAGDKLENKSDPEEITLKYKKKNLKLALRQGRITQEEYDKQIKQLDESSTAEFFKDDNGLRVTYNNKTMSIRDFLKKSKVDTEMNKILSLLKDEMKKDNFSGNLVQYIGKRFSESKIPNDVILFNSKKAVINKEDE